LLSPRCRVYHKFTGFERSLLKKSVSIKKRKRQIKQPCEGFRPLQEGKGLLSHAALVPLKDGIYKWIDKSNEVWVLKIDCDLGIVIGKEVN